MRARSTYQKLTDFRTESYLKFEYKFHNWQEYILDIIKDGADKRTVHWIYDSIGGLGKTTFATYLTTIRNSFYLKVNKKEDILFRVGPNVNLFVFDFPRSGGDYINYELIETLKDGHWEYGKYEGGTVRRNTSAFVFCFANILPSIK